MTIIGKVYLREYRRAAQWAGQWVAVPIANRLAARALAALWWGASAAEPTKLGPYFELYAELADLIAARKPLTEDWGITRAFINLAAPTEAELDELVRIYCTIAIGATLAGLSYRDRGLVAGLIRRYDPDADTPVRGTWTQEAEHATVMVRDRLVAALLSEIKPVGQAGVEVGELYIGEVQRTRLWLSSREHLQPRSTDGSNQQDHDSDQPRTP